MKKDTVINLPDDDENLLRTKNLYGETHTIEAVLGTKVNLLPALLMTTTTRGQGLKPKSSV